MHQPAAPEHVGPSPSGPVLGRRTFLVAAAAAGLAACSSGGSDDGADDSDDETPDAPDLDVRDEFRGESAELEPGTFILAQRFPSTVAVPGEVRLPISLSLDAEFVNDGPAELGAHVTDLDGNIVVERAMAPRFDITPASYYVWRPTIDEPGIYSLVVDGGPVDGANFQVFAPDQVSVPTAGEILPGFDTPTVDEPGGVDPICTREPVCPFHSISLAEALNVDRGVVYMVGTPAFCQTGTCAPGLETMIGIQPEFTDDFVFVHAEVFTDLTATTVAPAVEAVGLNYEPVVFITNRAGEIVERIDAIWGADELRQRLELARA